MGAGVERRRYDLKPVEFDIGGVFSNEFRCLLKRDHLFGLLIDVDVLEDDVFEGEGAVVGDQSLATSLHFLVSP